MQGRCQGRGRGAAPPLGAPLMIITTSLRQRDFSKFILELWAKELGVAQ